MTVIHDVAVATEIRGGAQGFLKARPTWRHWQGYLQWPYHSPFPSQRSTAYSLSLELWGPILDPSWGRRGRKRKVLFHPMFRQLPGHPRQKAWQTSGGSEKFIFWQDTGFVWSGGMSTSLPTGQWLEGHREMLRGLRVEPTLVQRGQQTWCRCSHRSHLTAGHVGFQREKRDINYSGYGIKSATPLYHHSDLSRWIENKTEEKESSRRNGLWRLSSWAGPWW